MSNTPQELAQSSEQQPESKAHEPEEGLQDVEGKQAEEPALPMPEKQTTTTETAPVSPETRLEQKKNTRKRALHSAKWRTPIPTHWNPSLPKETHTGLPNPAYACYRNVTFQVLVHSPVFYNWLVWYKHHHAPEGYACTLGTPSGKGPNVCKLCDLYSFFVAYWEGTAHATASLTKITDAIKAEWNSDILVKEEDPAEYLEEVLTQLRKNTKPLFQEDFDDIFQLNVVEVKKCIGENACKPTYSSRDQILLPLGFPNPIPKSKSSGSPAKSVGDALKQHLEHKDRYGECGRCHGPRMIQEQIGSFPEILFIQLNRIGETGKIIEHVHFSDLLTIETQFFDERRTNREPVQYKLYAVIMHMGQTMSTGHYKVGVKGSSGHWMMANDTKVQGWDATDFLNRPDHLADAYIFAYRRLPIDEAMESLNFAPSQRGSQDSGHRTITTTPLPDVNKGTGELVAKLVGDMIPGILDAYIARSEETRHKEWEKWTTEWMKKIQKDQGEEPKNQGTKRPHSGDGEEGDRMEGMEMEKNRYDWNKTRGRLEIILTEDQGKGERVLDLEVQGMHFNKLKGQVRKTNKSNKPAGNEKDDDDDESENSEDSDQGTPVGRFGRRLKDKLGRKRQKR